MHFSIPDTTELKDDGGTPYTTYNIHINGVFHCSARYKQLRQFHEQLRKEFSPQVLPPFPPKKLLSLTPFEVEERRFLLERYIQLASQDPRISSSAIFNTFLHSAQQDSQKEVPERVTMDVCLMNGHKIPLTFTSTDQTEDVLEAVAQQIEIPNDLVYYFGLFLVKKDEDDNMSIVRKLQDFESPFISLRSANKEGGVNRIVLRKSYWDSAFDDDLLDNKVTLNLLFVQTVSDIERGWVTASPEQVKHMKKLISRGSKKEYLRLARTLKFYGYIQFRPCLTDYPHPKTQVVVSAGGRELCFRVHVGDQLQEGFFKITRMKCWRITTLYPHDKAGTPQLELSFEYLMSKESLRWICIVSDQAMLMSMCLQSMVDELIMKKQGRKFKRPQDRHQAPRGTKASTPMDSDNETQRSQSPTEVWDRGSVPVDKAKLNGKTDDSGVTENDAFEGIGDDDL
ncbi:sorting nexin-17-like isoform X2 [Babylonia areolata]|uniref:sorting nexin-17-like isoform X2 n=1 Tax=Babylonia areolata TaxID=304850 RepID=UPI003FCFE7AC